MALRKIVPITRSAPQSAPRSSVSHTVQRNPLNLHQTGALRQGYLPPLRTQPSNPQPASFHSFSSSHSCIIDDNSHGMGGHIHSRFLDIHHAALTQVITLKPRRGHSERVSSINTPPGRRRQTNTSTSTACRTRHPPGPRCPRHRSPPTGLSKLLPQGEKPAGQNEQQQEDPMIADTDRQRPRSRNHLRGKILPNRCNPFDLDANLVVASASDVSHPSLRQVSALVVHLEETNLNPGSCKHRHLKLRLLSATRTLGPPSARPSTRHDNGHHSARPSCMQARTSMPPWAHPLPWKATTRHHRRPRPRRERFPDRTSNLSQRIHHPSQIASARSQPNNRRLT